jgi:hypothetical protein
MIVYNSNPIDNLRQFIKEALPTNKEKSLFIKQGIIKIKGKIYISDHNNILSDIPEKPEYKDTLGMLTNLYEIDIDNCVMTHRQWASQLAMALTYKDYYNELVSDYKEYREFCES